MKTLIFYFLATFCIKSFALSPDECRELIGNINSPSGQEEWRKCLFSPAYVRASTQNDVAEEEGLGNKIGDKGSINQVFGLGLGLNAISELKKLSKTESIKIEHRDCQESRCEIEGHITVRQAQFVFDRNAVELLSERFKPIQRYFKEKNEISDIYTKPTISEIGVQVVRIKIGTSPGDFYYLYIHDGLLIGVRPVDRLLDDLPLEKAEMIGIFNKKYKKLKTLHEVTNKEKYLIYKSAILRWEMNEDVEIRLFSDESENLNYSRCMKELSHLNTAANSNFCLPKNKNVLLYVLKQPFDALEKDILIKKSLVTDGLRKEYDKNRGKF